MTLKNAYEQKMESKVLKFQDFSITQILREINFVDSRCSKTAVLAILQALKVQKFMKNHTSEPLNVLKWLILYFKNLHY